MYSDTSLWLSAPKRWLQQPATAILKDWSLEMLLPRCAWSTASMEKLFHSKMDVGTAGMPPSHLPAHRLSLQPDRCHRFRVHAGDRAAVRGGSREAEGVYLKKIRACGAKKGSASSQQGE